MSAPLPVRERKEGRGKGRERKEGREEGGKGEGRGGGGRRKGRGEEGRREEVESAMHEPDHRHK